MGWIVVISLSESFSSEVVDTECRYVHAPFRLTLMHDEAFSIWRDCIVRWGVCLTFGFEDFPPLKKRASFSALSAIVSLKICSCALKHANSILT
jgi:hypothetical protein